jgi:hypothetical protein
MTARKVYKTQFSIPNEVVILDSVTHFWPSTSDAATTKTPYHIEFADSKFILQFKTAADRDAEMDALTKALEGKSDMNIKSFAEDVKSFLPSPTQVVFFLVVVFVLDKFLFKGALREYVMSLFPRKEDTMEVKQ